MYRHRHHIIPKHAGGDDSPLNLTPLISVRLHAAFHYDRWKVVGDRRDYIAWRLLMGCRYANIKDISQRAREAWQKRFERDPEGAMRQLRKAMEAARTPEQREKNSVRMKKFWSDPDYAARQRQSHLNKVAWHAGKHWSPEHRAVLSAGQRRRFSRPEEIEKLRESHRGQVPTMKGKHFPEGHPARLKKMGANNPMARKKLREATKEAL